MTRGAAFGGESRLCGQGEWVASGGGDVIGASSMASLTPDREFCRRRVETLRILRVILLEGCGVTVSAHAVPGMRAPLPVNGLASLRLFSLVQIEPALTAGTFRAAVPGNV